MPAPTCKKEPERLRLRRTDNVSRKGSGALRGLPRAASGYRCEAAGHQPDHGPLDHRLGVGGQPFAVPGRYPSGTDSGRGRPRRPRGATTSTAAPATTVPRMTRSTVSESAVSTRLSMAGVKLPCSSTLPVRLYSQV